MKYFFVFFINKNKPYPEWIQASGSWRRPGVGAGRLYLSVDNNSKGFPSLIRAISRFRTSDKKQSTSEIKYDTNFYFLEYLFDIKFFNLWRNFLFLCAYFLNLTVITLLGISDLWWPRYYFFEKLTPRASFWYITCLVYSKFENWPKLAQYL